MAQKRFPQGSGPSQRQLRVGELIRRRLSEVLARGEVHDPELNRMFITVGEVRASPDLKVATAYVSPLGGQGQQEMLAALRRNKGELRRMVAGALSLKFAPELRFAHDETFDRLDETRRLFAQEAVRRDLDDTPEDEEEDAMDGDETNPLLPDGPLEAKRDPADPWRDIREDLPRDADRDSDTAGGAADWDDEDEDREPEDYDPYMDRDGDAETRPLDELIRDEVPPRGRPALDDELPDEEDGLSEPLIAEIGEDDLDDDEDEDEEEPRRG